MCKRVSAIKLAHKHSMHCDCGILEISLSAEIERNLQPPEHLSGLLSGSVHSLHSLFSSELA